MPTHNTLKRSLRIAAIGVALVVAACSSSPSGPAAPGQPAAATPAAKGGAQLWQESCSRCHNIRSPSEFSNTEWEILVHHMRFRANLTGQEERRILEFTKSANQ